MTRALLDLLSSETDRLQEAGLYKREVVFSRSGGMAAGGMVDGRKGQPVINYTTHDYLGLSRDTTLARAAIEAIEREGIGLSSQRVMCGTLNIHKELEACLQAFLRLPDVILFGSGYQANVGLFSPMFGRRDCMICDAGIHPSLADGVRLAGSRLVTFRNNDPDDLEDVLKHTTASVTLRVEALHESHYRYLRRLLKRLARYGDRIHIAVHDELRNLVEIDSSVFNVVLET